MSPSEDGWAELRAAALAVAERAYAPYSRFRVGAAGSAEDGRLLVGCNVENAAYGVALCAECGVVSQLHATGGGRLRRLVCVNAAGDLLMPCGRCRQLVWEQGGPDLEVLTPRGVRPMREILPDAFDETDLEGRS